LSDTFWIKNDLKLGDRCTFSLLLFDFVSEYAVWKVQTNQEVLKLSGTHRLLISVDHANLLSENINTTRNTETLLVVSEKSDLEVNAEKTKYMLISCEQNAGQSCRTKIGSESFESVAKFKYLRTTQTNQSCINE
jgi:hypothetical protein